MVTDLLGKAAFPESHPQFAGIYLGALGDPSVRELRRWLGLRAGDRRRADRPRHRLLDPAHRPESARDDRPGFRSGPVPPLRRPAHDARGRHPAGTPPAQQSARAPFDNDATDEYPIIASFPSIRETSRQVRLAAERPASRV